MKVASKRVKELEQKVAALEKQIRCLENMHARIVPVHSWQSTVVFLERDPFETYVWEGQEGSYCGRPLTAAELRTRAEHPLTKERAAWTSKVSGVTHEELAQYVLDGKPIERKQEAKVVYTATYTQDTTTKSVKTDIGNISITEGRN
jgi:uncharacterized protein YhaN